MALEVNAGFIMVICGFATLTAIAIVLTVFFCPSVRQYMILELTDDEMVEILHETHCHLSKPVRPVKRENLPKLQSATLCYGRNRLSIFPSTEPEPEPETKKNIVDAPSKIEPKTTANTPNWGGTMVTLDHDKRSKDEVDEIFEEIVAHGEISYSE